MKYKEIKINNLIVSDNYVIYNYEENEKEATDGEEVFVN